MSFKLVHRVELRPSYFVVAICAVIASIGPVVSATAAGTRAPGTKTPVRNDLMVPAVTTPANKFCAVLPDGATFELVGVGESFDDDKAWWDGDGSPRSKPRHVIRVDIGNPFHKKDANGLKRLFAFECKCRAAASVASPTFVGETIDGNSASGSTPFLGVQQTDSILVVEIPRRSRATVRLKYAAGDWDTVVTCPTTHGTAIPLPEGGVLFGDPVEKDGETVLGVALKSGPVDYKVVAVDRMSHEHGSQIGVESSVEGIRLISHRFQHLKLAEIKEFRFKMRSWRQIEFRNISLHRGQKTNFAIFVDGKPHAAQGAKTTNK
jgi:hypothetical protein